MYYSSIKMASFCFLVWGLILKKKERGREKEKKAPFYNAPVISMYISQYVDQ